MTGGVQANEEMLRGLYRGTYPGLQFASPLCFVPIQILVQMMGYPTPYSEDDRTQAAIDEILSLMADRVPRIHRGALIVGNSWRWPRYDARSERLVWEAIPDSTVADILVDVASEEPTALLTDEMIKLSTGENNIICVQRKRRFDPDKVDVRWYGQKPASVQDYSARNVAGQLPTNFANEADEGDIRGSSVFARIIRDLKDYHDIDFRASETLARFRVKQKQKTKSLGEWLKANFGSSDPSVLADFDIADNDLVINTEGEETTYEFLPEGATAALEKALERKFWKVVEGSGIPELFWGPLATGNHASTDTQLEQAVSYATAKRKEFSGSWEALIDGSLRVLSVARMEPYAPFEMRWNRLEAISADMKSQILLRFAQSASALVNTASCTPKQLHTLWTLNFPESDPGEYEEFIKGLGEMAVHKAALGSDPFSLTEDIAAKGEKKTEDAE